MERYKFANDIILFKDIVDIVAVTKRTNPRDEVEGIIPLTIFAEPEENNIVLV